MASQRSNARELRLVLGGDGCGSPPGLHAALFLRVVSSPCACWPVHHAFVPSTHSCAHLCSRQEQRCKRHLQRYSAASGAMRCGSRPVHTIFCIPQPTGRQDVSSPSEPREKWLQICKKLKMSETHHSNHGSPALGPEGRSRAGTSAVAPHTLTTAAPMR